MNTKLIFNYNPLSGVIKAASANELFSTTLRKVKLESNPLKQKKQNNNKYIHLLQLLHFWRLKINFIHLLS